MRRVNHLQIAFLILLGAAVTLAMRLSEGATGSLEGFVLDEKGTPIGGCVVQVFNIMHGEQSTASAQPNGFFRIVALAGGRYSVWVEARGYTSARIPLVIVEEGRATRKNIRLEREIALSRHSRHRIQ